MRHEKIIRRGDGSRVKIEISTYIDYSRRPVYRIDSVTMCEKGKRTWTGHCFKNDFRYRSLKHEDRIKYATEKFLEIVTEDEMWQAKLELWEKLKP